MSDKPSSSSSVQNNRQDGSGQNHVAASGNDFSLMSSRSVADSNGAGMKGKAGLHDKGDSDPKCDSNECDSTVRHGRGRGRGRGATRQPSSSRAEDYNQERANVYAVSRGRGMGRARAKGRGRGRGRGRALVHKTDVFLGLATHHASGYDAQENGLEEFVRSIFPTSDDDDDDSDGYLSVGHDSSLDECSSTTQDNPPRQLQSNFDALLSTSEIASRMKALFEKSLRLHLTGEYMKACDAVATPLYPHQMFALAWMSNRENFKNLGMKGGILADDMGLGKTLSILALILTNFHDGMPMAKPQTFFKRQVPRSAMRYMPESTDVPRAQKLSGRKKLSSLSSLKMKNIKKSGSAFEMFDHLNGKWSIKKKLIDTSDEDSGDGDPNDDSIQSEPDEKEYDAILKDKGLSSKLLCFTSQSSSKTRKDFDSMNDDEDDEDAKKLKRIKAKKLDNFVEISSSDEDGEISPQLNVEEAANSGDSDFEGPCSSSTIFRNGKRSKIRMISSGRNAKRLRKNSQPLPPLSQEGSELPDVEYNEGDVEIRCNQLSTSQTVDLTPQQQKKLKIPPKETAQLNGRRKATLIVAPTSLIGQWLSQIELHISKNVDIEVFVHHHTSKAQIALELQDKHIVLTTYGTLMAEFREETLGPLLMAKWLRVVLDEGHLIKNHLSKTFKAAKKLDTQRKWIVSGTPIQNNLTELWALLNWLDEPNYSDNRHLFNHQIESAIKSGHPRGVERLQVLMEAICLRRTKSDQVEGKPLVSLPTKTVRLKELDFTEEERIIYDAYHSKGKELILKYMRRGTLLRNYAHVFAVMMRLRQLCCHKELLPVMWNEVNLNELTALAAKEMELQGMTDGVLNSDETRQLAEQLRDLIKDGMSDECSICLSEMVHPVITPCAHVYCRNCIIQHIDSVPPPAACPLCRGKVRVGSLLEAARDEESEEASDEFEDIIVETSSTKVMAVLKELEISRQRNSDDKVIICSQFTSLLSILQPLLTNAGYNWTRLDGSMNIRDRLDVISSFQSDKKNSPKVLLLSLRAGGVGLNLTAANRLYLLDPAWNPSTEEQCFDRIHRLGQTKDVEIVKFVVRDSIEQRMLKIQDKKRDLISGAFRQTENERRQQRIQDIRDIFGI